MTAPTDMSQGAAVQYGLDPHPKFDFSKILEGQGYYIVPACDAGHIQPRYCRLCGQRQVPVRQGGEAFTTAPLSVHADSCFITMLQTVPGNRLFGRS